MREFLTDEEIEFTEQVASFLEKNIDPTIVRKMDEEVEGWQYPYEFYAALGRAGYLGLSLPKEYGGQGKNIVHELLATVEVGALSVGLDCVRQMATLVGRPIQRFATDELKRRYLVPTLRGELIPAEAITEPLAGSDAARMRTTAVRDGDEYVITGEKRFQVGGIGAHYFLVWARTNQDVPPHKGISAFIIDRNVDIKVEEKFELLGYRGIGASDLVLNRVRVPKENLVGDEGQGWAILTDMLPVERILTAGCHLGAARECLKIAVNYSGQRKAFGKAIREFQGVSFKIADMAVSIDAGLALCIRAARLRDKGASSHKEAAEAKLFSTEAAWQSINNALQILGGIGYTNHYPVERYLRDARDGLIGAGTSEVMRLIIEKEVYKELLGQRSFWWGIYKGLPIG